MNKVEQKKEADTLRTAVKILEERGWAKGEILDENGCVCAVGAIAIACGKWSGGLSDIDPDYTDYVTERQGMAVVDTFCELSSVTDPYRTIVLNNRRRESSAIWRVNDASVTDRETIKHVLLAAADAIESGKY